MPELPEVETVVRGLRKNILQKEISHGEVLHRRPLVNASIEEFQQFITGGVIEAVDRFGKYIHLKFKSRKSIVSHLRMTGKYIYLPGPEGMSDYNKDHVRVIIHFTDKSLLLFKDVRIFGTMKLYYPGECISELKRNGVEPLSEDLTVDYLREKAGKRTIPVKNFLLDQSVIAGLGNIYACEALFHARIHPAKPACSLSQQQLKVLIKEIRSVLRRAIDNNGTSISDFKNVDDKSGSFQSMLTVYQRRGAPCRSCCGGIIEKIKQGGRSTFYCPHCQE